MTPWRFPWTSSASLLRSSAVSSPMILIWRRSLTAFARPRLGASIRGRQGAPAGHRGRGTAVALAVTGDLTRSCRSASQRARTTSPRASRPRSRQRHSSRPGRPAGRHRGRSARSPGRPAPAVSHRKQAASTPASTAPGQHRPGSGPVGLAPELEQVLLQAVELLAGPLEIVAQRVEVPLEQLAVLPDDLGAVAGVDPDTVVTDPAGQLRPCTARPAGPCPR